MLALLDVRPLVREPGLAASHGLRDWTLTGVAVHLLGGHLPERADLLRLDVAHLTYPFFACER